jgi:hypothetical protein
MPKSLVEKLAEVVRSVDGLKKLGDNGEYAYLRILDISNALREKLFDAGILIIPSDVECQLNHFPVAEIPNRVVSTASVETEFVVTDGAQELRFRSYGFARDMDAKCVAIAQTAALKSFLKRLALIFGDWDDPEHASDNIADLRPDLQRKIDEQTMITWRDVKGFYAAAKKSGFSLEEIQTYLRGFNLADPHEILQQDFKRHMAWALKETYVEPA